MYTYMMYLPDTKSMVLQTDYGNKQYNTLNISNLGGGIAQQIIHLFYLFKTSSDASAKCLNVMLNLPKTCVHVRTHGKTVSSAILFVG